MGAKQALLALIAERYIPGTPVTPDVDAAVKAAASVLEDEAGPPDLHAEPTLVNGVWQLLFDSRDLLYQSSDMGRMSGGLLPDQTIDILNCWQELWAGEGGAPGMYRNTMTMQAGGVLFSYISTASFFVKPDAANMFQVSFSKTAFVPVHARDGGAALRKALKMPDAMPLQMVTPPVGPVPSPVTYCDGEVRSNRGGDYVAVLRKLL